MAASGAGKTTLLNIIAERPAVDVISGVRMIDTIYQDEPFARKVGYAQQDLHLPTMTVRKAFNFSALLRQPAKYSKEERLQLVDEVIADLDLSAIQHAVIGPLGAGLNVEQQKRVTIGVELVARLELLLFLDEPTSGLDSSTAWSICGLLRKLCDNGQTILCTIHQPSAEPLQMFDRLLLLQQGKLVYFGDVGHDAPHITTYFEKHGARHCQPNENPAEWMLKAIDNPQTSWSELWLRSEGYKASQAYLDGLQSQLGPQLAELSNQKNAREFASSFWTQLRLVTARNLQHDWRTPF
jgi:ABC-type multidrug transport system ATPase subunit